MPDGTIIGPEEVFDGFFGNDTIGRASKYALLYMIYFTMRRSTGGEGHVGVAVDKGPAVPANALMLQSLETSSSLIPA